MWGNDLIGIFLLAKHYYFSSLVTSYFINRIKLLLLFIILTTRFSYLYAIGPP